MSSDQQLIEKAREFWQDADTKPTPILMADFTSQRTADLEARLSLAVEALERLQVIRVESYDTTTVLAARVLYMAQFAAQALANIKGER